MDIGINNHLKRISSELFIKTDSSERRKIDVSLNSIFQRLEEYFEDEIDEVVLFGSYSRDTILPRRFDENSDIDILIQFNTNDRDKLKPESYRNQLKKFAEENYPKSTVVKDHPSIMLSLDHINFDLVPAIFDEGFFYDSIEIPNKSGGWMETEPHDFNSKLTKANKKYNSIVKPIIRLLKYWNATHGYPFNSYDLELQIADMNFNNENYESGFLYAIRELSSDDIGSKEEKKVGILKKNGEWVEEYLDRQQPDKAKGVVKRILPNTFF